MVNLQDGESCSCPALDSCPKNVATLIKLVSELGAARFPDLARLEGREH
jgi:hypothetical protein